MSTQASLWALKKAINLLNERKNTHFWCERDFKHDSVITLAKLIEQYEKPPVDPIVELFATAFEAEGWKSIAPALRKGNKNKGTITAILLSVIPKLQLKDDGISDITVCAS